MTLVQRTILWLGCNALVAVWILPPIYTVHADGTRLEANWEYLWHIPHEWSVSVPLTALRLISVVVFTAGMWFVFRPNAKTEAAK